MKTISRLNDLAEYGFSILTGEADKLGLRLLVDLNYQAIKIFCDANGMRTPTEQDIIEEKTCFAENWNSGSIASVMLDFHNDWKKLTMFAFWQDSLIFSVIEVMNDNSSSYFGLTKNERLRNDGKYGIAENDDGSNWEKHIHSWEDKYMINLGKEWVDFPSCYGEVIHHWVWKDKKDSRNRHAMSGRVA